MFHAHVLGLCLSARKDTAIHSSLALSYQRDTRTLGPNSFRFCLCLKTCVVHLSDSVIEHTRVSQHDMTEPKTERMNLPQWDGDSSWRDYQQEVRLPITGENLEVNGSVAARPVGGLKGARRVGLAMTDQELLPTARDIPDNGERKADRNRRGVEALMARLETESNDHSVFFATNKLQRNRSERVTDYITKFEEGIKTRGQ